jgi:hypothetical protein
VVGSPFSSTTDVVSGLNASTAYFFRITAKDTLFNISAPPTVVGPIVTNSSFLVESPQNTRINQASASTVPPVGTITSSGSTASSLGLVWSLPVAIYDAGLNGWSLYASGTTNGVQVARDGTVFQTTSGVQNIVYWNHNVWMQTNAPAGSIMAAMRSEVIGFPVPVIRLSRLLFNRQTLPTLLRQSSEPLRGLGR